MKRNSLIGLAVAAAVAIVLATLVVEQRTSETRPAAGGGLMFEGLLEKVNSVASLKVDDGGEGFTLTRTVENWGIAEKSNYPVRFDIVKKVIMGVAELELAASKTKDPARHGVLGLNDPGTEEGASTGLVLADDSGATLASLLVGKTVRAGGEPRYVRRPNEDQTWLSKGALDVGKKPLDWVDILLTEIRHDRVRKITFTHPDGDRSVLERMDQSDFDFTYMDIPDGMRALEPSKLNSVGGALAFLSMRDVRSASGLNFDSTEATVTRFETWDGIVVTVSSIDVDGDKWAQFQVEFNDSLIMVKASAPETSAGEPDEDGAEAEDPYAAQREEVSTISAKTEGWAYALDENKMNQLRRRSEDFVELEVPDDEGADELRTNE